MQGRQAPCWGASVLLSLSLFLSLSFSGRRGAGGRRSGEQTVETAVAVEVIQVAGRSGGEVAESVGRCNWCKWQSARGMQGNATQGEGGWTGQCCQDK